MSEVYDDHKDEDGFLYITYSGENTFGQKALEVLVESWPEGLDCHNAL